MRIDKERFDGIKSYLERYPIEGYEITESQSVFKAPYRIGSLSFNDVQIEFLNIPRFKDTELLLSMPSYLYKNLDNGKLKEACKKEELKARIWGDKNELFLSVSLEGQMSNKDIKETLEKVLNVNKEVF